MATSELAVVGDHFLIGLRPSITLDERDRQLLADLRPAGIILYKSNFAHGQPYRSWLALYRRLIDEVRDAVGRERIFIAIDHEGGRVCRTPPPITRFGYAADWANQAAAVGHAMGRELASLGINLNFAPVLDIHSNPKNPVIGTRAFGSTSDTVITSALQFLQALQEEGVIGCGKHFPGHGDTDSDSHYTLPVLQQDIDALQSRELQPFAAAIAAGIRMLMTSHIFLPRVDEEPVTLSIRFIDVLLRQTMGFQGVVVSDDIGMQAISGIFENPAAAVKVLHAGCDMIMVCAHWTDTERSRGFARAVFDAQKSGVLDPGMMQRSKNRIQTLLAQAPQSPVVQLDESIFAQSRRAGMLFAAETVEVI